MVIIFVLYAHCVFFFKQKTAYEMRISDWSSDVCSSDLTAALLTAEEPEYSRLAARLLAGVIAKEVAGQEIRAFSQSIARGHEVGLINERLLEIGRASCRERGCQYV